MSSDYDDSHLAAIYDHDNPSGADHDFYRELADELHARVIVDLGCGTGLLTAQLVRARAGDDAKHAGLPRICPEWGRVIVLAERRATDTRAEW